MTSCFFSNSFRLAYLIVKYRLLIKQYMHRIPKIHALITMAFHLDFD